MRLLNDINIIRRENKTLIYSNRNGSLFEVNELGEFIIKLLKQGLNKNKILDRLINEFSSVNRERIIEDFNEFIKKLKEECLLLPDRK